jgi:hypothetical protein
MKPRDIFGLAVRLLGLFFLYLAMKAFTQLLDWDLLQNPDKTDLINDVLPLAFDLLVAAWLIHGGLIIRWAYPESSKPALPLQPKQPAPTPGPVPPPAAAPAAMETAETRLAALVEKPKDNRP